MKQLVEFFEKILDQRHYVSGAQVRFLQILDEIDLGPLGFRSSMRSVPGLDLRHLLGMCFVDNVVPEPTTLSLQGVKRRSQPFEDLWKIWTSKDC